VKRGQVIAEVRTRTKANWRSAARPRRVHAVNGYNFEDAIMISEKVVKEDIYNFDSHR